MCLGNFISSIVLDIIFFACFLTHLYPTELDGILFSWSYHCVLPNLGDISKIFNGKSEMNMQNIYSLNEYNNYDNLTFFFSKDGEKFKYFALHENFYPKFGGKGFKDLYRNTTWKYYVYKDCYANGFGEFTNGTHWIRPPKDTGPSCIRKSVGKNVIATVNYGMTFGHSFTFFWSHFMEDFLAPLVNVPSFWAKNAYVIVHGPQPFTTETLDILGYKNRYFFLDNDNTVHAHNLLVAAENRPHLSHYGPALYNLGIYFKRHFGTLNVVPTVYAYMNRKSKIRHIGNMKEVIGNASALWPNINFQEIPDGTSMMKSAKIWASLLFLYMPGGSNTFRCMFMNDKTTVVMVQSFMYDLPAIMYVISHGVHLVSYNDMKIDHFGPAQNIVNMTDTMNAFRVGLYFVEHRKWPSYDEKECFIDEMP